MTPNEYHQIRRAGEELRAAASAMPNALYGKTIVDNASRRLLNMKPGILTRAWVWFFGPEKRVTN